MSDLTLESFAKRVEAREKALSSSQVEVPQKDWRKVVGMFGDIEFMREVDEEFRRILEAEQEVARRGS